LSAATGAIAPLHEFGEGEAGAIGRRPVKGDGKIGHCFFDVLGQAYFRLRPSA